MRLGSRQFTPRAWAIAVYVLMLLCMLWLGNWQLERAALKISMQEAADSARLGPARELRNIGDPIVAAKSYTRVRITGRYDDEHQFLWDNRTNRGMAGYEVLVPLVLENGDRVLVNRGWVAAGLSRSVKPDTAMPASALDGPVSIEGWLSRPSRGLAGGEALSGEERDWPRLLHYLDYAVISALLNAPVVEALLQPQALDIDTVDAAVLSDRPEWLIANWQPAASGPAKHYSYAFQWFAMALGLTVLFVIVNLKQIDHVSAHGMGSGQNNGSEANGSDGNGSEGNGSEQRK